MNRKERNSSVEVLRILCAIGVVCLHYNLSSLGGGFSYVDSGSTNEKWLYFVESISIGAVDVFIMISAYYSCNSKRSKTIKAFGLLVQTVFFVELFYYIGNIIDKTKPTIQGSIYNLFPRNYFVILFCSLYLIAPFLNKGLGAMSKNALKKLVILCFVLFSVETIMVDTIDAFSTKSFASMSTISATGSHAGYTITNFILIYIIGAALKLLDIKIRPKLCVLGVIFGVLVLWLASLTEHALSKEITAWNYNNPIVIFVAAFLVDLATQIQFKSRIVNEIAGASFTCFLFHAWFFRFFSIENACHSKLIVLMGHQLMTAIVLFVGSYVAYKVWSFIWKRVLRVLKAERFFTSLDNSLYESLC